MLCNSGTARTPQTIGLLGGTFDPPHLGHLSIAKAATESGIVDIVWFLPCWQHAFGKKPTPFYHRAAMCYLLVRDEPNIYVCTDEAEIQSTYSVDILKFIKSRNQGKEFRLIMGTDNYWKMDQWKEKDKVLALAPPIWVMRPGFDNLPENVPVIQSNNNESSTGARRFFKYENRLSVETRDRIFAPAVYDYIKREGLYVGVAEQDQASDCKSENVGSTPTTDSNE